MFCCGPPRVVFLLLPSVSHQRIQFLPGDIVNVSQPLGHLSLKIPPEFIASIHKDQYKVNTVFIHTGYGTFKGNTADTHPTAKPPNRITVSPAIWGPLRSKMGDFV